VKCLSEVLFGIAELQYERLDYPISERPLNPPILGDFEVRKPPRIGGLGGEFRYEFSNACYLSDSHKALRSLDQAYESDNSC
jgi:hypothetical protein